MKPPDGFPISIEVGGCGGYADGAYDEGGCGTLNEGCPKG